MATDPSDQRHSPRVPFVLRVSYPDRDACADATENLSRGGVFIQTEQVFEVGEQVPLSLSFPGLMDPIEIVGRVVWLRAARDGQPSGVGIGVERAGDRRRLEKLLDSPGAAPKGLDRANVPAEGFRVLIVEDNPHIVEMYSYVLKKLAAGDLKGKVPLEVDFASDGHEALQKLAQRPYHLVMTDLYMPVMDGFALVERIREDERLRNVPVIAISAGGKDAQERALSLGVDIYLRKPVKFAEVLETVKHLLRL